MNRRQSLEKGILSPPGPFLTPSPSPSVQHSPRLQPSPSQSPFQQDVLLVTNNNHHFINTFTTTQEQDLKSGTPNRRLSLNHIGSNAGTIVYRPSPTQSPANTSNVGNEFNTTLVGSNNISLNKKGKRTPQHVGQYATISNSSSPKASKKTMGILGSPIVSPSPSPTLNSQPMIQQFPIMNANNSIVFMQQPTLSQRQSIIQTSNTHHSNVFASSSNSGVGAIKQNKAPQQILPKPAVSLSSASSSSLSNSSIITSTASNKQIVTQSKMVQQSNQQFQSPPHQSQQLINNSSGNGSSPSPQPHQVTQSGSILLPSGSQPLLLNQMPVLVQQNTSQGVQLILRPPSAPQLAAPSLVIHNRPGQMQQHQPQQLLRILNTNGSMQLATATNAPTFIVSSQANIIQQNLQSVKTPSSGNSSLNQIGGIQQSQQQTQRQPQQIINSHILGQSMAQIQNLQLNGNLTQIQMPNGQFIQQLPAQFQQNLGGFNQIQPMGSQITAIATNATFQSPPPSSTQSDIMPTVVSTSSTNQIQFATNQQMTQSAQILSPVGTPQPQMMQAEQSILSSPTSINFNSQPQTAVILTGDKQMHELSSPPPHSYSIIHQSGATEMITLDMMQHQNQVASKPARKAKKSKKQKALELAQQQQQQQHSAKILNQQNLEQQTMMISPPRNSQAPTGKLDLANVMKLCGIMEDDDFMDTDEPPLVETTENSIEQTQTIHIPPNSSGSEGNATDIMITFPGGSSDQPFTFTIPSSSLENPEGTIIQGTSSDGKMNNNVPFMIRFDPADAQNGAQPYTISIPNMADDVNEEGKNMENASPMPNTSTVSSMCVPSFVNSVLNSSVTPTIQSQINEIQNQLMALPPVTSTSKVVTKAPRQKKQTTKKAKKQLEKTIEVPTQIGNIQISQIDGTAVKNSLGNKNINNINNQIQIMPILEKCQTSGNNSGQIMEKHKMQVPVLQHTISHQNNQQNNNHQNQQNHHHQQNSQNSGPSQVNINVQQNQLINVTNNLQMQVIANPHQQQQHNSGATPAHAPPSSSSSGHHTQSHNSVVTSQALNTQNLIGNIINAQQGQQSGNIIIQSGAFNHHQQQNMPANIQVNIQNQTIANNIITTAPVNQNHVTNNHQQQQQQPTAQSILSQLTGNLVLSLSEDGRLILRHDPNIPQDAQSQMILQTILTGALGNVSLINEPLKTPMAPQNHHQTHQQHVINANGKIQQVSTVQNKNVIISSQSQPQMQSQPQQIFNNVVQSHSLPTHQIQVQSGKMDTSNSHQQQQQTMVLPNQNILKFVELPKIQPNQQLFSLNTITNEITQLNPNQTTAALSPMERLLIVPSGINAQQLAQCLSQGQIHFNNIGQAPTTDPNKVQHQLQQNQQMQQQMSYKNSTVQKVNNQVIKKEPAEPKPKKGRGKKAKLLEEQKFEIKKEPTMQSPPPMKMISLVDTKIMKASTITTSTVTTTMNSSSKNTITISPNPTIIMNPSKVTANVTQHNNIQKPNMKQNSISVIPTASTNQKQNAIKGGKNQQIKSAMTPQLSPITSQQAVPPPLVSVNQAPMPRVQTIQLTPQKQQSLKNVQMQIQQLSAKLQNKNLLATLTADVDPNNPVHNNPLPLLNNIIAMTDSEIYNALQRLFVEQQKILATGKIIPTIPAAAAAAVSPQINSTSNQQQTSRTLQNSNMQTQPIFVNNSSIVTAGTSAASLFSVANSQTIAPATQVNSPVVKQEPLCSASTSNSQPPPLVVSTPIQMQIKSEILSSPLNGSSTITTTSPPATGSIVISPKYITSNRITIDPPKEQKLLIETKKEIIVPAIPRVPELIAEPANFIKQQQIAAAIEATRKLKVTRSSLFERQMCVDKEGCTKPEYKNDFTSKEDAVKRLIRYHCLYDEVRDESNPKEEYEIEEQAKVFIASYKAMQKKYQLLLMKQSQQHAPTSELMMLDRLRVADLKDEIVSMQAELNTVLFEQHKKSQIAIKNETIATPSPVKTVPHLHHNQNTPQMQITHSPNQVQAQTAIFSPTPSPRLQTVPIMTEPSQILKAKQEQKLFDIIKNEKVKTEIPEVPTQPQNKTTFSFSQASSTCHLSPPPQISPNPMQQKQSKFDKLKNEQISVAINLPPLHVNSKQQIAKPPLELKEELDDFDIESEIRPNLIMKKCDSIPTPPSLSHTMSKKASKIKEKEREFSPLSDYFNNKQGSLSKNKTDTIKSETSQDGSYDEWLSIQKELNLQLPSSNSSGNKKKESLARSGKNQSKNIENDLSEIFEHHVSPKSVEKQLDDLFNTASKSNDLLTASSPLTEFFHVETSNLGEKTVEHRLEALFGETEDSGKSNQQDLVETRLEQLFQGSVAENDESALDNASFLYKDTDMTYEMIQKQIHVSTSTGDSGNGNTSNTNKRQWDGTCDMFASNNSSMLYPSSSPTSKRACTAVSSVSFDNKWIEDSFDFATEIMSTETTGDDITKHRSWNGNIDSRETMIGGLQSPHQNQFHLPSADVSNTQQHRNQNHQQNDASQNINMMDRQVDMMDTQIPNLNYDDVDDISRQVQNAIDSILNLQSSDPLHYQLDSSFLELNAITAPSGAPNSPLNLQQSHPHQLHNPQPQYHMHGFNNQKLSSMPKRKYSRMDDIGDCLIGGSNLDDSPSALALSDQHTGESSSASVGEFVNNLLNCEEKSITTS